MEKEKLAYFKTKLEKEKSDLESELETMARPDPNNPGQWVAKFPASEDDSGHEIGESRADESDQYGNQVALSLSLSKQLADVDLALEKIGKGTFGKCENCNCDIPADRLEIFPAARLCFACDH